MLDSLRFWKRRLEAVKVWTTQHRMWCSAHSKWMVITADEIKWKMTDVEHRHMIDWNISFIIELIICNFIRFTFTFFSLYNRAAAEEMWVFLFFELEWPNGVEFLYFGVILIKRNEKPSWVRAVLAQTYLCNHVYGCWSVHLYRFQLWKNKFELILMKFLWINKTNKSG